MSGKLLCLLPLLFLPTLVTKLVNSSFIVGNALAAKTIRVPGDYPKIQAAIDAAANGDTVLVAAGTYRENIDFRARHITVRSQNGPESTIIDGGKAGSVVTFQSGESPSAVLEGFKLQHGLPREHFAFGGGVVILNASPVIRGCTITVNGAANGGGVFVDGRTSAPLIEGNLITRNLATEMGGGIEARNGSTPRVLGNRITENISMNGSAIFISDGASPIVDGNMIRGNNGGCDLGYPFDAEDYLNGIDVTARMHCGDRLPGAVFIADQSSPVVSNNTIESNIGGGMGVFLNSAPLIKNNLITSNYGSRLLAGGIMIAFSAAPVLSGNTIRDNQLGEIWIDETSSILDEENKPIPLTGYHIVEDLDEAFSFSAGWSFDVADYHSGATRRVSCPGGTDAATVRFSGTAVSLIFGAWNNNGKAAVKIDGLAYDPVDMYVDGDRRMGVTERMIAKGLSPSKEHVLEISPTGEKNPLSSGYCISVDAVGVIPGTSLGDNLVLGSVWVRPPPSTDIRRTPGGQGRTREVPDEHTSIQAAIDAARNGDTIVVAPGTYKENIDFMGKRIVLRSRNPADEKVVEATLIEAREKGPAAVVFARGEDRGARLEGFTIRNPAGGIGVFVGDAAPTIKSNTIRDCAEGGIECNYSRAPLILNNTLVDNGAIRGGGIRCFLSTPEITANTISGNAGPGIESYFAWPVIVGNSISDNARISGISLDHLSIATVRSNRISGNKGMFGGIYLDFFCNSTIEGNRITDNTSRGLFMIDDCSPVITNNVITGNETGLTVSLSRPRLMNNTIAGNRNQGIYMADVARIVITNTILWNSYSEIYLRESSSAQVSYSVVEEGWSGEGNLSENPLFVGGNDYHLRRTSPCIDAGTADGAPEIDIEGGRRPHGAAYDIGAYEWGDTPIPDVKLNGSDGPLLIGKYDELGVTISLNCREWVGRDADLWVGVLATLDGTDYWFTLDEHGVWQLGIHPFRRGPLGVLSNAEILKLPLPKGIYYFFFVVDGAMDGVPSINWWDIAWARVQ